MRLIWLEKAFVVAALSFFSGAVLAWIHATRFGEVTQQKDPASFVLQNGILLLAAVLVVVRWKAAVHLVLRERYIFLLLLLAVLSSTWSPEAGFTLRRSLVLVGATVFGLYIALRFTLGEQLVLVGWALGIGLLASVVAVVVLPEWGLHRELHQGAWRGVFVNKNVLGRVAALALIVFVLLRNVAQHRSGVYAGLLLSVALLIGSTSRTALAIAVVIVGVLPLIKMLQARTDRKILVLVLGLILGGGVASLLVSNTETVLATLGRDVTLTGRTDIWRIAVHTAVRNLLLGHGYQGFWNTSTGLSEEIWRAVRWKTPHAHNGFLDLGLDLGLVGLALFLLSFAQGVARGFQRMQVFRSPDSLWPLAYFGFLFLYNITESTLLWQINVFWIIYVALAFSLARHVHATRSARATSPAVQNDNSRETQRMRAEMLHAKSSR